MSIQPVKWTFRSLVVPVVLLAVGIAGCDEPETDDETCMDKDGRFSLALSELAAEHGTCASDGECTVVSVSLSCPEVEVQLLPCPRSVARDQVEAYEQAVEGLKPDFCGSGVAPCTASGACVQATPACVDGVCQLQYEMP